MQRQLHMEKYPGWSARDNYAKHKKKRRKRYKIRDGGSFGLQCACEGVPHVAVAVAVAVAQVAAAVAVATAATVAPVAVIANIATVAVATVVGACFVPQLNADRDRSLHRQWERLL